MARNAGRVSACSQFRSRLATHCAEYPFLGAGRGGVVHGLAERGGHYGNLWCGPAPRHTVGGGFFHLVEIAMHEEKDEEVTLFERNLDFNIFT